MIKCSVISYIFKQVIHMKREKKKKDKRRSELPMNLNLPCFEFSGNREVVVEGSRGVLEYAPEVIRLNTDAMVVSFFGRNLNLKCISPTALIIDGFVTSVEFTS